MNHLELHPSLISARETEAFVGCSRVQAIDAFPKTLVMVLITFFARPVFFLNDLCPHPLASLTSCACVSPSRPSLLLLQ